MPSHKIHLGIAQEVNKQLKLDSDLIKIGSVLPDLTKELIISSFVSIFNIYNHSSFHNLSTKKRTK